ncbi:MAG TPA: peptidylprolyl isomerase [Gallionella sp.]
MLKYKELAIFSILVLAINSAYAENKSAAKVNGVSVPQARIDLRVKMAVSQGQPDTTELRKSIREDMINLEVLVQEAKKAGLDKNEDVVLQTELNRMSLLGGAFVQDYAKKNPIPEDKIKQEYENLKASLGNSEYSVSHILVATEEEAKAVIGQLNKKGKFDKIAKEKSKDVGSAEKGGSLGWAVPTNFVPSFANAMVKLKKGEYTKEPVQSQFGWHVIKMNDVRNLQMPAYDELKPQLQQRLQQQQIQSLIADLRSKAKIE